MYADYDREPLWPEQSVLSLIGKIDSHPKRPHKQHNEGKPEGLKKVKKWLTKSLKCKMYWGWGRYCGDAFHKHRVANEREHHFHRGKILWAA
jgi:hypothetical protein